MKPVPLSLESLRVTSYFFHIHGSGARAPAGRTRRRSWSTARLVTLPTPRGSPRGTRSTSRARCRRAGIGTTPSALTARWMAGGCSSTPTPPSSSVRTRPRSTAARQGWPTSPSRRAGLPRASGASVGAAASLPTSSPRPLLTCRPMTTCWTTCWTTSMRFSSRLVTGLRRSYTDTYSHVAHVFNTRRETT